MIKQKGSVQVIVILILVVLVVVAGYFYFAKSKQTSNPLETSQEVNNQENSNTSSGATQPNQQNVQNVAPTPSYATYTSPDGKVSFQYRSDLFIAERSGVDDVLRYKNNSNALAFAIFSFSNGNMVSYSSYIAGQGATLKDGEISAGKTRTFVQDSKHIWTFIDIAGEKTLTVSSSFVNDSDIDAYNQAVSSIVIFRDKVFK